METVIIACGFPCDGMPRYDRFTTLEEQSAEMGEISLILAAEAVASVWT
ncbi:MAG TPA: hypothetical protein VLK84_18345 [Longimicrobium sp.]|nr:hypothetical protein [Longimicrobium sp.]